MSNRKTLRSRRQHRRRSQGWTDKAATFADVEVDAVLERLSNEERLAIPEEYFALLEGDDNAR